MDVTLREIIDVIAARPGGSIPADDFFPLLGKKVFIRTVTYHYTGLAHKTEGGFLCLRNASWIADSGRWKDALETGKLNEVEPYPSDTYINIASIVDICEWPHALPREQK